MTISNVRGIDSDHAAMHTKVLKVRHDVKLGHWADSVDRKPQDGVSRQCLDLWEVPAAENADPEAAESLESLRHAASNLRNTDVPVAFPTETVYGLGADATRSAAVKGIYSAKGRPSDNPLIIHVCDLTMLREFMQPRPSSDAGQALQNVVSVADGYDDSLPAIYQPLIERFWPGPLTILVRNPVPSRLAAEVTAGLLTVGCRMPASALARSLIRLAGVPLAAPSANASTRPSPTAAAHVVHDLAGRIALVLDGGPCAVGVESTVVDGLSDPPAVLRPGGISLEQLRACPGWEGVAKGYRDDAYVAEKEHAAPRAPGMKYKHYSPKAKVVLYEAGSEKAARGVRQEDLHHVLSATTGEEALVIGVIRSQRWPVAGGLACENLRDVSQANDGGWSGYSVQEGDLSHPASATSKALVLDVNLGQDIKGVAHALFAALRDLDGRGARVIFVEGVSDADDIGEAVMNRLRKAASEIRIKSSSSGRRSSDSDQ